MCGIAGWLGASADGKDSADGMVRALRRRGPDADGIKSWPQATRCVRSGGVVAMIEPWVTPWSRFVYTRLHHEPFQPETIFSGKQHHLFPSRFGFESNKSDNGSNIKRERL